MTTQEALDFVRSYNLWRRGDEDLDQPNPKELGIAIDVLCDSVEQNLLSQKVTTKCDTPETIGQNISDNLRRQIGTLNNTPETDNLARGNHVIPTEFAQDLERKLRKARDTVLRLRVQRGIARNFGEQMERERDEARNKLLLVRKERNRLKNQLVELDKRYADKCCKEARLQMEVDERRALRQELEAELNITAGMDNDESLKKGLEAIQRLKQERDEARAALSQIAEDCRAWLDSENDEPSAVFVKLVGQYAYDASRKEASK